MEPTTQKSGKGSSRAIEQVLAKESALLLRTATSAVRAASGETARLFTPNTNLTAELNNIDFHKMIGGPLQACVDAQVTSALATVNFINSVGFKDATGTTGGTPPPRELVMVDFTHTRQDAGATTPTTIAIKVPLLAMLPIPSLRIEHVIIDFNVKLNSVESSSVSSDFSANASGSGRVGPINMRVSASYQRKTATNVEVKKEYALNVNVKAVQDEIPAGLEKILNLLAA